MTDFLFELGCEEIPAKHLAKLSAALENGIIEGLQKAALTFRHQHSFATPRRLGILISGLPASQPTQKLEKKGPSIAIGLDAQGKPTPALVKFAEGLGISPEKLERRQTDKGEFFYYSAEVPGRKTADLLPEIILEAFKKMPLPKPMRWASHSFEFLRPVRWIVSLLDNDILPLTLFGITSDRITYGHRFHAPAAITLNKPSDYEAALEKAFVIASREKRKDKIIQGIELLEKTHHYTVEKSEDLIIEVTDLVEWPVVLQGSFEERFLKVPAEALSTSMRSHQKSFSVKKDHQFSPYFIFVSNIEAKDPSTIIKGNEKVMRARLSDALFFYEADLKVGFDIWLDRLKTVTFQEGLGTLYDQSKRLEELTKEIFAYLLSTTPSAFGSHPSSGGELSAQKAGLYSKCDLMSNMVYEFPELQGTMGYYYGKIKGLNESICIAFREQYKNSPPEEGWQAKLDGVVDKGISIALSLANKFDLLVGLFSIGKMPTGDKDPFGLRRAAIGIVKTLVENNLAHSLTQLIEKSQQLFVIPAQAGKNSQEGEFLTMPTALVFSAGENGRTVGAATIQKPCQDTQHLIELVKNYILERFKFYCLDQGISQGVINAVLAVQTDNLTESFEWMKSIQVFLKENDQVKSLLNSYKRLNNILKKHPYDEIYRTQTRIELVNTILDTESAIATELDMACGKMEIMDSRLRGNDGTRKDNYLKTLASEFTKPLENFFDKVRIDVEDKGLKERRIALLNQARECFLQIADFSLID
jgi:glycyl-tRNA synthetase beta chain